MPGRRGPPAWLARPSASLRYVVYARVYALATVNRLTLPDATADDWLPAALVHLAGAALVAFNGCFAGWVLCAAGAAAPLLFLRDQLTQSVFLLGSALGALACWVGPAEGRRNRMDPGLFFVVRVLTVGVYGMAALHKVNRDFFTPEVSCANGGLGVLAVEWGAPLVERVAAHPLWPLLFVAAEAAVALLFVLRPGVAVAAAMVLHLPLTIIFAPAFAFTMMTGWVAFFREDELKHFGATVRRHWASIAVIGGGPAALSLSRHSAERWSVDPDWCAKEGILWMIAAAIAVAWVVPRPQGVFAWWSAWRERPGPHARRVGAALGLVWVVNALTPYTGLQLHHTAAMLSNLRIDAGCWNSLLFPESVRIHEPYVRIESVALGDPAVEQEARDRLWTLETLQRARRRWCRGRTTPVELRATWRRGEVAVGDLCDAAAWPFPQPLLPGFRPHQVNLTRACPQPCVH